MFGVRNPYGYSDSNEAFVRAMRENCAYQYKNCTEYAKILDGMKFSPSDITDIDSLAKLPFVPTLFFKKHHLSSMPRFRIPISATSSGTKGSFSRVGFDTAGLLCGAKMVVKITHRFRLLSARPVRYIVMGYKHHKGNETAVTKTAFGATFFAPAISRRYALNYKDGSYKVDLDTLIDNIVSYSEKKTPVRFMGFPSYTYFLMTQMEQRGIHVRLAKGSRILLGGGWKQFYTQQVDKTTLYLLAEKVLGIPEDMITEFYGAVEHPILYADCERHHFHIPAYSRVIIRDVDTLEPLEYGKTGLVNLLTPMVYASPLLSVMTDDLGILHPAEECSCGIKSPYLEIIGRVGLNDIKTCAAGAAEFLKKLDF